MQCRLKRMKKKKPFSKSKELSPYLLKGRQKMRISVFNFGNLFKFSKSV